MGSQGRTLAVALVAFALGQLAFPGTIKESRDFLFGASDRRAFEALQEYGVTSMGALPPPHNSVLVNAAMGASYFEVAVVASDDRDPEEMALTVQKAVLAAGLEPGDVLWSKEDEGVVVKCKASSAKLFARSGGIALDMGGFRRQLTLAGVSVYGGLRISNASFLEAWSEPVYTSRRNRFFSLDADLGESAVATASAEVKPAHLVTLVLFCLLPFVGCFTGLVLGMRYAKISQAPKNQKRSVYMKLVMGPTLGGMVIHFPLFIGVVASGYLRHVTELWLGSSSVALIFAPVMLFSFIPIVIAFNFALKAEKDLFKKPVISAEVETATPVSAEDAERLAEALKTPRWQRYAIGIPFIFLLLILGTGLILGEKQVPDPSRIMVFAMVLIALAIIAPIVVKALGRGKGQVDHEQTERVRRLFVSLDGDPSNVRVDGSPFAALAIQGTATPRGVVVVSAKAVDSLTDSELKTLLAHELAHVKFRHPGKRLLFASAVLFPVFALLLFRGLLSAYIDRMILVLLPFSIMAVFLFASFLIFPRRLREAERKCDRWALEQTRDPNGMLGLWKKMWAQSGGFAALVENVSTHPSLLNRFRQLKENAIELGLTSIDLENEIDEIVRRAESDE